MSKQKLVIILLLLLTVQATSVFAVQRFPKPEFETGYIQPETQVPSPRTEILAVMDVVVLLLSLSVISWIVLKKRSRNGVFLMSVFSLIYFGFYREGCICAIGSIQNITLALFDYNYILPLTVIAFFIIPLVFTLFFGRTFCAGVCPFGAMQDMVAFRPQKLGSRLNAILGMVPYIYLGLAVLYAATGTDFIICRYDPFVGIFRFNASFSMFVFAGILLLSGIFIARPYCRFLCPYGVLLNWVSRFSRRHITITPAECIQCRLCEDSCPYDAIDFPVTSRNPESRQVMVRKLMLICTLIPFLIVAGGWTGIRLHETLAGVNGKVKLARQLLDPATLRIQSEPFEITAYKSSGKSQMQVNEEASVMLKRFYTGGWILGGFIGLMFGVVIAGRMLNIWRTDYVPNKGTCLSCTRCVDYCPVKSDLSKVNT
ncbi:MAG: 4Fe-4S binding protein [Bacteroidales bacterium]|jgi:ferredoxin|nr:4Fe-4S binding protein [Bacteroidales bacterium]